MTMLLGIRFGRKSVRLNGRMVPVNSAYLVKASKGLKPVPDTLRATIAKTLGLSQKEVFPEYAIVAKRLRQEREARQLTQRDVAALCQELGRRRIRDAEISALECGTRYAHEGTRQLLAEVFKMPEAELFPEYQFTQESHAANA